MIKKLNQNCIALYKRGSLIFWNLNDRHLFANKILYTENDLLTKVIGTNSKNIISLGIKSSGKIFHRFLAWKALCKTFQKQDENAMKSEPYP